MVGIHFAVQTNNTIAEIEMHIKIIIHYRCSKFTIYMELVIIIPKVIFTSVTQYLIKF